MIDDHEFAQKYKVLPPVFDPEVDLTGRGRAQLKSNKKLAKKLNALPQIMPIKRATKAAQAAKTAAKAEAQWEWERTRLRDNWDLHWHGGLRKGQEAAQKRLEMERIHAMEEVDRAAAVAKAEREERRAQALRKEAREERRRQEAEYAFRKNQRKGWCIL